jgi:hypothetical protein
MSRPKNMRKSAATKREQLIQATKRNIELAVVYAEDGAFATAAKCLRETADLLEAEHNARSIVLNSLDLLKTW